MQEIAFQGFKLNAFSGGATLRCLEPSSNAPPLASGKPAPPLKDVTRSACPLHPVYILLLYGKDESCKRQDLGLIFYRKDLALG